MPSTQSVSLGKKHSTRSSLAQVTELPPCKGPKLHRFEHHSSPIQWLDRIDAAREDLESIDAYVFKVKIEQKEYALKIVSDQFFMCINCWLCNMADSIKFKPFDVSELQWRYETVLRRAIKRRETNYHLHPFFSECRAYGRLNDRDCQKSAAAAIVAPCHGFLFLTQTDEDCLQAYKVNLEINNLGKENFTRHPTPAIVKDLMVPGEHINENNALKILKGICAMYDYGIFNGDICARNFVDGKLVDFGSSMTQPHYILDSLPEEEQLGTRCADFVLFDAMIEEDGIGFPFKAHPNLTDVTDTGEKALNMFHRLVSSSRFTSRRQLDRAAKSDIKEDTYRNATTTTRKKSTRKRPR